MTFYKPNFREEIAVLIVSWNQVTVLWVLIVEIRCRLTFLCMKFSTQSPTLMTSFKFDICQCLSFLSYEIWPAVCAIFSHSILINTDLHFPGSSDSMQENYIYLTRTWRLVIFSCDIYLQVEVPKFSPCQDVFIRSGQTFPKSQARIGNCTHHLWMWFYLLGFCWEKLE